MKAELRKDLDMWMRMGGDGARIMFTAALNANEAGHLTRTTLMGVFDSAMRSAWVAGAESVINQKEIEDAAK